MISSRNIITWVRGLFWALLRRPAVSGKTAPIKVTEAECKRVTPFAPDTEPEKRIKEWLDKNKRRGWALHLFLTALIEGSEVAGRDVHILEDDSIVTTQAVLALHLGCSKSTINDCLRSLQQRGDLKFRRVGRRTRISEIVKVRRTPISHTIRR